MSQNIYDDVGFFAAYSRLRRSAEGLAAAPEWPVLRDWIGDIRGARVLDLGCGFGWFCRWAREAGAAAVLGVDLSENMLASARGATADGAISYERGDLESLDIAAAGWDLIYSSLALHYVAGVEALFGRVALGLRAGGRCIFSVEHPMFTAPSRPGIETREGRLVWPMDSYLRAGPRVTDWLAPGVVKQHRPVGAYVTALGRAGLVVDALEDWGPSEAEIAANPGWEGGRDSPNFLLVRSRKLA